jgi:hypothetical protein
VKVRLLTRCGCERLVEVDVAGEAHVVALRPAPVGHIDDFRFVELDDEGMPIRRAPKVDRRVFRLDRQERDGTLTYLEEP